MQSAFVDIGLDRDAFLYVSDFFEDNEEYDKIVTSVEDKVLHLEKGSAAAPPPPPPAAVSPAVETADAEPPAAPARALQVTNGQPAVAAAEPRTEGRDNRGDRDRRRGRRSRRRRGRGGRGGLPESKYLLARTPPAGSSRAARAVSRPNRRRPKRRILGPARRVARQVHRGRASQRGRSAPRHRKRGAII